MMIIPVKIQEIDDVAHPNPIHQIPRSPSQEKGKGKRMEGITLFDPPVYEDDRPYGHPRNDDEKDGPKRVGRPGQEAEGGPRVPHVCDMKEILDDFDRLKIMEGSIHIGLGDLIENKDYAKDHDQDEIFLPQDWLFPPTISRHRRQIDGCSASPPTDVS